MLRSRWLWAALVLVVAAAVGGWYAWDQSQEDPGGSPEAFCALVADRDRFEQIVDGFDPSDVARSLDQLRTARAELEPLLEEAPAEVREDLQIQADALDTLVEALTSVDPGDPSAAVEALRAAQTELDEVLGATMRLELWTREHCAGGQTEVES